MGASRPGFPGASEPRKPRPRCYEQRPGPGVRPGVSQPASLLWAEDAAGLQQGPNVSTKPLRGARRRTPGLQSGVGRPETSDVVLEGSPGSSRTPVAKRAPDCGLQPPGLLVRCGRQQVLTPAPGSWLQNPGRPAAMKGGGRPRKRCARTRVGCPRGLPPGRRLGVFRGLQRTVARRRVRWKQLEVRSVTSVRTPACRGGTRG